MTLLLIELAVAVALIGLALHATKRMLELQSRCRDLEERCEEADLYALTVRDALPDCYTVHEYDDFLGKRVEVYAVKNHSRVLVKAFEDDDKDYNLLCARELLETLNEK